VGLIGRRLPRP